MSKCEIVILACVALAGVLFLIDRLMSTVKEGRDQVRQQVAEVKTFENAQQQLLATVGLQPHERRIIDRLLEELPANPFARQWVGSLTIKNGSAASPPLLLCFFILAIFATGIASLHSSMMKSMKWAIRLRVSSGHPRYYSGTNRRRKPQYCF